MRLSPLGASTAKSKSVGPLGCASLTTVRVAYSIADAISWLSWLPIEAQSRVPRPKWYGAPLIQLALMCGP